MKDSVGKLLPNGKFCSNFNNLGECLSINTFLLACKVSLNNGYQVIYEKEFKRAFITDDKGYTSIVSY